MTAAHEEQSSALSHAPGSDFNPQTDTHRRFNPLSGGWVLVSPHRSARPWLGQLEQLSIEKRPVHDPACYLCPSNLRASGERNPEYADTFVFDNDYPALTNDSPPNLPNHHPILRAESARGYCKVICFSPRHDLSLGELDHQSVKRVVETWLDVSADFADHPSIKYIQIFENRGAAMGASNPHPHGQAWATEYVPSHISVEQNFLSDYYTTHKRSLIEDYLKLETESMDRLVCCNDHFVALVPYWAFWPYETLVVSRRRVDGLAGLSKSEQEGLADITRRLVARYDNLFHVTFPYSMGIHQAPTDGLPHPEWHLHLHFLPPLLRSANIRKFQVGFELLAESQRDITPEVAARTLRALSELHNRHKNRTETPGSSAMESR